MLVVVIQDYFLWHYTKAFHEIFHVWKNFVWFIINFFSLPQLLKSFFAPWKRMTEDLHQGFSFENIASYLIIGLLSRLVGVVMRSIIIISGLLTFLFSISALISIYIFWVFAPAFLVISLIYGLALLTLAI